MISLLWSPFWKKPIQQRAKKMTEDLKPINELYEPEHPVNTFQPTKQFDRKDFATYIDTHFKVVDKIYEPLKALLSSYGIDLHQIMGGDHFREDKSESIYYEKAKLLVLVRRMSELNKKWRSILSYSKPTMSAVPGSQAPNSATRRDNENLHRYYISCLKQGIPPAQQDAARPLLDKTVPDVYQGGHFEWSVLNMSSVIADFISARQRRILVLSNKQNNKVHSIHGHNFWPEDVSPEFGIAEAINTVRDAFNRVLNTTNSDAKMDIARIRLLKDFFLDSESSYWRETYELNQAATADFPIALERLDLTVGQHNIYEKVAQAFDTSLENLPSNLVMQAKCLVWLCVLKNHPIKGTDPTKRKEHFQKFQLPHYIALTAVMLNDWRLSHKKAEVRIPGDTNKKVLVYKSFQQALIDAEVNLDIEIEANIEQLDIVFYKIDTKVMAYMAAFFSLATNADDAYSKILRTEYVKGHAEVRIRRTELLAELPKMLKPYSCLTTFKIIRDFTSLMIKHTHNPLL